MWRWLKKHPQQGRVRESRFARIERKIDTMARQISDLKPILDATRDEVATFGGRIDTIVGALTALQQSAANQSSQTNLSQSDQSSLDAALDEAKAIKDSLDGISQKLDSAGSGSSSSSSSGSDTGSASAGTSTGSGGTGSDTSSGSAGGQPDPNAPLNQDQPATGTSNAAPGDPNAPVAGAGADTMAGSGSTS